MPLEVRAGHLTYWQIHGTGARPALALHCTMAHSGAWAGVAAHLPDLQITAFDLPGDGKSAGFEGGDYQRLCTQIAASFVHHPLDLIGHSFGASVALRLAVAAPEAVRSLTLIEPVLFAAARGSAEGAQQEADHAHLSALVAEGQMEAATRAFVQQWGTGQSWDSLDPRQRQGFIAQLPLVLAAAPANFDDSGQILRPGGLESLDAPVMIIRGDNSPAVMERLCDAIAARLPDVGHAVVPGAGHMLPMTHARQVADLIALNINRG
jgi:pimeloyl-ACP methyl ester carboxylesterase